MYRKPDWAIEGRDWPHRSSSRFVEAGGLRWHVQMMGKGPPLLLLHGAGAATHSWRALAPLLADDFTLIAPDLPGHGFTATPDNPQDLSLPGMAARIHDLLATLAVAPCGVVGHSAGAAIALRMSLDGLASSAAVVSLNGALLPFPGIAAHVFPPAARLLFLNPLAVRAFAWRAADTRRVEALMRGTGSTIDAQGIAYYARLFQTPGHLAGVLGMMSRWDLFTLRRDLPALRTALTLIVGTKDRAIAPESAQEVMALVPTARVVSLPGLGHLAHEESPRRTCAAILEALTPMR
ncbi:MAG: alpha/beta fold hydrolase [Hyphomonadaceae bacterium]|nr:alpha/beta fold hydrolase [Hyphomonadaceae bacterium]